MYCSDDICRCTPLTKRTSDMTLEYTYPPPEIGTTLVPQSRPDTTRGRPIRPTTAATPEFPSLLAELSRHHRRLTQRRLIGRCRPGTTPQTKTLGLRAYLDIIKPPAPLAVSPRLPKHQSMLNRH